MSSIVPQKKSSYELFHWLGGNYYYAEGTNLGLWPEVPEVMLWEWIDRELPERAEFAAGELPPLVTEHGLTPITCKFLSRYSALTKVCDILTNSRVSGLVEGSFNEFNKKRLQQTIDARSETSDAKTATGTLKQDALLTFTGFSLHSTATLKVLRRYSEDY